MLFGFDYQWAFLLETLFLILAIIYLYKIVLHYFKDANLAVLTVFIFSFFPQVWQQSREFHLDVPLVALLLVSYYYLILSNSLRNVKYAVLFFIFFTLGQLTKWYGFVFLVVPFIYEVIVKMIQARDFDNKERIRNTLIGSVIVIAGAFPWYILNFTNLVNIVGITAQGDAGDPTNIWSLESIFHYLEMMMSHQLTFVAVLMLLGAMYLFNKHKVPCRNYVFHLIAFPYVVFTLIQNKDLRYILPLTPMFAFYIAYALLKINFMANKVVLAIFSVYLMMMFFFLSFNQLSPLPVWLQPITVTMAGPYYTAWLADPLNYSYNSHDWQNDTVLQAIENDTNRFGTKPANPYKVLSLSENQFFSVASLEMHRWKNEDFNIDIVTPFYQLSPFNTEAQQNYLDQMEYAVVPDSPGPAGLRNYAVLTQLINFFKSDQNKDFVVINKVTLPDTNVISLYKRVSSSAVNTPNLREDSLKISIGNVLFLDREKTQGLPFNVYLYDADGKESIVDVSGGGAQRRIPLDGYSKVRIDLPVNQQNVLEMRGWDFFTFLNGTFVRDASYATVVTDSGNEFIYDGLNITPRSKYPNDVAYKPNIIVTYADDGIKLSLAAEDTAEKVYVAYASIGWQWNTLWLDQNQREVTIPTTGLLQLEITQRSQLIVGFPTTWGFFKCYDGRAVCFYPSAANL